MTVPSLPGWSRELATTSRVPISDPSHSPLRRGGWRSRPLGDSVGDDLDAHLEHPHPVNVVRQVERDLLVVDRPLVVEAGCVSGFRAQHELIGHWLTDHVVVEPEPVAIAPIVNDADAVFHRNVLVRMCPPLLRVDEPGGESNPPENRSGSNVYLSRLLMKWRRSRATCSRSFSVRARPNSVTR